jgi:hypothetical protein
LGEISQPADPKKRENNGFFGFFLGEKLQFVATLLGFSEIAIIRQ